MAAETRPRTPIPADWILKRIKGKKKVRLKNAVIKGDLVLNKLPTIRIERTELQKEMGLKEDVKIVQSSIIITGSSIQGKLDFSNVTFSEDASFREVTFSGDANFEGATFSGDANFGGVTFNGRAEFRGANFGGKANFGGTRFNGYVEFGGVTFNREAHFDGAFFGGYVGFGATFNGKASFWTAWFGYAAFSGARFREDANFGGATFYENADFGGATFGNAGFGEATFSGKAEFVGATIKGDASFKEATFSGNAKFREATFSGNVNFGGATFEGYANFKEATFSGDANFYDATFSGNAEFWGTNFNGNADFGGALFNWKVEFRESTFDADVSFMYSKFQNNSDFSDSKFDKFANFRGSNFKSGSILSLKEIVFEKIYLDWNSIENLERHFDNKIYLSLIENYKERGFFEDADNCYYQSRIEFRKSLPEVKAKHLWQLARAKHWRQILRVLRGYLYKQADWIIWALYGYGVKPERPLLGLVVILVIFGLLYSYLGIAGNTPVDAFNTSSAILLSGSQLIETPTYPASGYFYWIFTLEKLLGSLFFGLFLVSLGRTILR